MTDSNKDPRLKDFIEIVKNRKASEAKKDYDFFHDAIKTIKKRR